MPSKGAGTDPGGQGYLCPPRSLLYNRVLYTVSMWVRIGKNSITSGRPRAALFSHHRHETQAVPYQSQYKVDANAMTIERLPDGTHQLKAGTFSYINYTPANVQINGTWNFKGVQSAPQPPGTYDDGKWHHILLVRADAVVTVYRDGLLLGSNSQVGIAQINANNETKTGISLGRFYGPPAEAGIPYSDPNAALATFDRVRVWSRALSASDALALYKQDVDRDGLWDITEAVTRVWRDNNSNAFRDPGETLFGSSPFAWQPADNDIDQDGLSDLAEQNIHRTEINNPDTDGDLLPDGWEVAYGINPLDPSGINGGGGHLDNDGLDNLGEYSNASDPRNPNTDGGDPNYPDFVNDGAEAANGSNPSDPTDGGQQLPLAEKLSIKLGIGDKSGSESEDYVMHVFRIDP